MQTIIKPAICPVWGKIWVTPYGACPDLSGRSEVRGKRSPQAINPGGVVYTIKSSTPPWSCYELFSYIEHTLNYKNKNYDI